METKSVFYEWLQAAYEIADEQLQRIALPVGTFTGKSILAIQSKQSLGYKGANYNARKDKQTRTEGHDRICVLKSFSGATYRCNISTIFKVVTELESKAGIPRKAIQTWKVEDQRMPKQEFYISLPCKKTMRGFAKMTKKSILAYDFKEGTISGKDELGNLITIPVAQESDQQLPDFIFNLPGHDLEHLYGDITVKLYYDVDERGDYKDVQLALVSEDNWLVGLDTSQTDRKGWRRAFQLYPSSYEDDRDYRQILISISKELQAERKRQATLAAKAESSSVENKEGHAPTSILNKDDDTSLSQDYQSSHHIDSSLNSQESTISDAKIESGTQLHTKPYSNINHYALEYIMPTEEDRSNLEGFDNTATEKSSLAGSFPSTENKRDDSAPNVINKLAKEIQLESESSSTTDSSRSALDKLRYESGSEKDPCSSINDPCDDSSTRALQELMEEISREAQPHTPINHPYDDSSTRALQELMEEISREAQPCGPTENSTKQPPTDLPDDLIDAIA